MAERTTEGQDAGDERGPSKEQREKEYEKEKSVMGKGPATRFRLDIEWWERRLQAIEEK